MSRRTLEAGEKNAGVDVDAATLAAAQRQVIAEGVTGVVGQLAEAAEEASDEREAKAVLNALSHTPGLTECAIAPDVLAKLLPDDGVVELPRSRASTAAPSTAR